MNFSGSKMGNCCQHDIHRLSPTLDNMDTTKKTCRFSYNKFAEKKVSNSF